MQCFTIKQTCKFNKGDSFDTHTLKLQLDQRGTNKTWGLRLALRDKQRLRLQKDRASFVDNVILMKQHCIEQVDMVASKQKYNIRVVKEMPSHPAIYTCVVLYIHAGMWGNRSTDLIIKLHVGISRKRSIKSGQTNQHTCHHN